MPSHYNEPTTKALQDLATAFTSAGTSGTVAVPTGIPAIPVLPVNPALLSSSTPPRSDSPSAQPFEARLAELQEGGPISRSVIRLPELVATAEPATAAPRDVDPGTLVRLGQIPELQGWADEFGIVERYLAEGDVADAYRRQAWKDAKWVAKTGGRFAFETAPFTGDYAGARDTGILFGEGRYIVGTVVGGLTLFGAITGGRAITRYMSNHVRRRMIANRLAELMEGMPRLNEAGQLGGPPDFAGTPPEQWPGGPGRRRIPWWGRDDPRRKLPGHFGTPESRGAVDMPPDMGDAHPTPLGWIDPKTGQVLGRDEVNARLASMSARNEALEKLNDRQMHAALTDPTRKIEDPDAMPTEWEPSYLSYESWIAPTRLRPSSDPITASDHKAALGFMHEAQLRSLWASFGRLMRDPGSLADVTESVTRAADDKALLMTHRFFSDNPVLRRMLTHPDASTRDVLAGLYEQGTLIHLLETAVNSQVGVGLTDLAITSMNDGVTGLYWDMARGGWLAAPHRLRSQQIYNGRNELERLIRYAAQTGGDPQAQALAEALTRAHGSASDVSLAGAAPGTRIGQTEPVQQLMRLQEYRAKLLEFEGLIERYAPEVVDIRGRYPILPAEKARKQIEQAIQQKVPMQEAQAIADDIERIGLDIAGGGLGWEQAISTDMSMRLDALGQMTREAREREHIMRWGTSQSGLPSAAGRLFGEQELRKYYQWLDENPHALWARDHHQRLAGELMMGRDGEAVLEELGRIGMPDSKLTEIRHEIRAYEAALEADPAAGHLNDRMLQFHTKIRDIIQGAQRELVETVDQAARTFRGPEVWRIHAPHVVYDELPAGVRDVLRRGYATQIEAEQAFEHLTQYFGDDIPQGIVPMADAAENIGRSPGQGPPDLLRWGIGRDIYDNVDVDFDMLPFDLGPRPVGSPSFMMTNGRSFNGSSAGFDSGSDLAFMLAMSAAGGASAGAGLMHAWAQRRQQEAEAKR